jgi:hypothetical protein
LIINYLSAKTHETTGNKPEKPISSHSFLATATEMNNKPNMTRNDHKKPADRYKKAQPLMVPFDAEEESPADKS